MTDISSMSDAELEKLANPSIQAISDEELARIAGPVSVQPAASVAPVSNSPLGFAAEVATSLTRPAAALIDFAMTPVRGIRTAITGQDTTLQQGVAPRGAFIGEGLTADVISASGEFTSAAIPFGAASRFIANGVDDLLRSPNLTKDTFDRVMQSLGSTTLQQDMIAGGVAGVGAGLVGEGAVQFTGDEESRLLGEGVGAVISPVAWMQTVRTLQLSGKKLLEAATPSIEQIRGTSRALFAKLDQAGASAVGPGVRKLQNDIDNLIESALILPGTGQGALVTRLNAIKKVAEEGGASFAYLDLARSELKSLQGVPGPEGINARAAADLLDDAIMHMVPTKTGVLGKKTVGETYTAARELWRRASVSETLDDIVFNAGKDAARLDGTDFLTTLRAELGKLPRRGNRDGRFFNETELGLIDDVVKGGTMQNLLQTSTAVGINSQDLTKHLIISGVVGMGSAGAGLGPGAAVGTGLLAGSVIAKAAQLGANSIMRGNVNYLQRMIQAGTDGRQVVKIFLGNTTRADRTVQKLTHQLINNGADTTAIRNSPMMDIRIVRDAVALADAGMELVRQAVTPQ